MRELLEKLEEAQWSGEVETKWTPPEGLFTKSAGTIASVLKKNSKDLAQAMELELIEEKNTRKKLNGNYIDHWARDLHWSMSDTIDGLLSMAQFGIRDSNKYSGKIQMARIEILVPGLKKGDMSNLNKTLPAEWKVIVNNNVLLSGKAINAYNAIRDFVGDTIEYVKKPVHGNNNSMFYGTRELFSIDGSNFVSAEYHNKKRYPIA